MMPIQICCPALHFFSKKAKTATATTAIATATTAMTATSEDE
jgi:hypothetical protein